MCNRLNNSELLDRHNESGDEQQKRGWTNERPQNAADRLPGAGSIDFCRFEQLAGNFLQGGQVDDHVVAQHEPDPDDVDGIHGGIRRGQPPWRVSYADGPQDPVDRPVVRAEQQHPHKRYSYAAGNIGHEIQGAQQLFQINGTIQNDCHDKGEGDRNRYGGEKQQGVFDGDIKYFVAKHPPNVGESDKLGFRAHEFVIREHEVKGINRRDNKKQQHTEHIGPNKQIAEILLPLHPGCFHERLTP